LQELDNFLQNSNETTMPASNFTELVATIEQTDTYFLKQVQKQINTALTVRNWLVGLYIVEYEQHGTDRAEYGKQLYKKIAGELQNQGIKGLQERNLYLCKDFYKTYPNILQSATAKSYIVDFQSIDYFQSDDSNELFKKILSDKLVISQPVEQFFTDPNILINYLTFTHIVELIKADTPLKRYFCSDNEMEADDNPPVGIILCAGKNENLVKYATANLPQPVFVSKYLINLPKEDDLMKIIE
jgi:DUF1016 N-terminal domain/YhcG PDDEXK nuclease domain